jgi:hypothetical protein
MSSKQTSSLTEIGGALLILGIGVKLALWLGAFLNPLASLAVIGGIILLIAGAVFPNKR